MGRIWKWGEPGKNLLEDIAIILIILFFETRRKLFNGSIKLYIRSFEYQASGCDT